MGKYWFPAKRYGWGWGRPLTWQGWSVLGVFILLLAGGAALIVPTRGLLPYLGYAALLAVALVGICWLKGEPPRWRWGGGEGTQD
jgi:hypothetical protein